MTLLGREIQALLAVLVIQEHVPFATTAKPQLTKAERECAASAQAKLHGSRTEIWPTMPRKSPNFLHALHAAETSCPLTVSELTVLAKLAAACLTELTDDMEISAQVGGTRLSHLREAHEKLRRAVGIGQA